MAKSVEVFKIGKPLGHLKLPLFFRGFYLRSFFKFLKGQPSKYKSKSKYQTGTYPYNKYECKYKYTYIDK